MDEGNFFMESFKRRPLKDFKVQSELNIRKEEAESKFVEDFIRCFTETFCRVHGCFLVIVEGFFS